MDTNGEQITCDFNLFAGRSFLGFATKDHGPISFADLNSKINKADGATVDVFGSEMVSAESQSDYSNIRTERRVLPFGKLVNFTSELSSFM